MCEWGTAKPWLWAKDVGHMWRTTGDIQDRWEGTKDGMHGVMDIVDLQVELYPYSGPGHWNDPDMLEAGNGGMTANEYRAHFSLWAMLAAPLIAGNDLRSMSPETKAILTNMEVIAVNQDSLGEQARRVHKSGDLEVWARPLQGGGRAVVRLNRGTAAADITADWGNLQYPASLNAAIRDLWQAKDLGRATGKFTARVEPHSVVMVTIRP
jgi:alpha-galactosidase